MMRDSVSQDKQKLLESIWAIEASYKRADDVHKSHDHRRHLSHSELERVFALVKHRALLKRNAREQTR